MQGYSVNVPLSKKIKRKAHVKQSFSLDFLERGTFTEYPHLVTARNLQNWEGLEGNF